MVLALCIGLCCVLAGPPAAVPPLNDGQLQSLQNDPGLPDSEAAHRLVALLVQRIALWRESGLPEDRATEGMDTDGMWIVTCLANRDRLRGRAGALLKQALADPALAPATPASARAGEYLRIALFWAAPTERPADLTHLLETHRLPFFIGTLLGALERDGIPISATPLLLELTAHPDHSDTVSCLAPGQPQRQYPLRRAAAECLQKLGITCQVIRVRLAQVADDEDLWEELIVVDLGSLQRRLAEWKASPDPATREAAAQVATRIRIEPDPGNGRPNP